MMSSLHSIYLVLLPLPAAGLLDLGVVYCESVCSVLWMSSLLTAPRPDFFKRCNLKKMHRRTWAEAAEKCQKSERTESDYDIRNWKSVKIWKGRQNSACWLFIPKISSVIFSQVLRDVFLACPCSYAYLAKSRPMTVYPPKNPDGIFGQVLRAGFSTFPSCYADLAKSRPLTRLSRKPGRDFRDANPESGKIWHFKVSRSGVYREPWVHFHPQPVGTAELFFA